MSGISRLTALEIFTNPNDLEIVIGQEKSSGKYAIAIMRGPGHNFKMMLDSESSIENFEDAFRAVKETLETIQQAMTKELGDPENLVTQFLNPDSQVIDQSKTLNPDLINRIMDELRRHKVASTYKMKAVTS
jgi:hypothetical protein